MWVACFFLGGSLLEQVKRGENELEVLLIWMFLDDELNFLFLVDS